MASSYTQQHAGGSGLKAAALLNNNSVSAPSCYVTTGGTGTSMTGVGHYVIHPGGDPTKAGIKVEDIAKETKFFGALLNRQTMDDFLNVQGPKLGDAGRVFISGTDTATNFIKAPRAPSSPIMPRPQLFGKPISCLQKTTIMPKGLATKATDNQEEEDTYSDDDEFEDDEEESNDGSEEEEEDEETIRARKELEEQTKARLVQEAFAYIANLKINKRQNGGRSTSLSSNEKRRNKKKKQQLGWNNKSQIAIKEQQRRNKTSLYGKKMRRKKSNNKVKRKKKIESNKLSNHAFLEKEQDRYEERLSSYKPSSNNRNKPIITMRDLRRQPQMLHGASSQQENIDGQGDTNKRDGEEGLVDNDNSNNDKSLMANRRMLAKNSNNNRTTPVMMTQWKEKSITKPILIDASSKHANVRHDNKSTNNMSGGTTKTKSRKLSAEEIEQLTRNFEEGIEIKKLQNQLTKATNEEKQIQQENSKKTFDFMEQIKNELNL